MSYRSSSNTGNDANTSTKSAAPPSGCLAGDVITAIVTRWTTATAFTTVPTGFTDWGTTYLSSDSQANMHIFTKPLTVNGDTTDEPDGLYQFGWASGSNDWSHLHVFAHPGRRLINPIEDVQVWRAATAGNFGSITVNCSAGADLIWSCYNDSSGAHTPPSTFTERIDFDSGSSATKDNVSSGANTITSPNAGVVASSSPAMSVLISLAPAAGGGGGGIVIPDRRRANIGALLQV